MKSQPQSDLPKLQYNQRPIGAPGLLAVKNQASPRLASQKRGGPGDKPIRLGPMDGDVRGLSTII